MGVFVFNSVGKEKWNPPTPVTGFPANVLPTDTWLLYDDDGYNGQETSAHDAPVVHGDYAIAPAAVHFFSEFANAENRNNRFKDWYYVWDFGDDALETWGVDGKSKNVEYGATACHIYETPGTYTATLQVYDLDGLVTTEFHSVTIADPDVAFSGTDTICVCKPDAIDWTDAPAGSLQISLDDSGGTGGDGDINDLASYMGEGKRVLFRRGSSWAVDTLLLIPGEDNQRLGAFGPTGTADKHGIYDNNPVFTLTDQFMTMTSKPNLTVMDITFIGDNNYSAFNGAIGIRDQLYLRLNISQCMIGIGWSHLNGSTIVEKNNIAIYECYIHDCHQHCVYGGSQRYALLGTTAETTNTSHVVRCWQGYRGNIRHNDISGAASQRDNGHHAIKFHSPGYFTDTMDGSLGPEATNDSHFNLTSRYAMITDNTFGQSGPWPVNIAPQNAIADERISNVILEKNRYIFNHGTAGLSADPVYGYLLTGRGITFRNNLADMTGSDTTIRCFGSHTEGDEPYPKWHFVYNNTGYREDASTEDHRVGFFDTVQDSYFINNIGCFPNVTGDITVLEERTTTNIYDSANGVVSESSFVDPDNIDPLARDFDLVSGATPEGAGDSILNYDNFDDESRVGSAYNQGAY